MPTNALPQSCLQGEKWDLFGKIASFAVPLLLLAGVGVGGFAASQYDQGATVFLENPQSAEDSAKLVTFADSQE